MILFKACHGIHTDILTYAVVIVFTGRSNGEDVGSTENCNPIEKKGELCFISLKENFIHLTTVFSLFFTGAAVPIVLSHLFHLASLEHSE